MNRVSTNFRDRRSAVGADVLELSSRDAIYRVFTQEYTWIRIAVSMNALANIYHSLPFVAEDAMNRVSTQ